MVTTPKKGHLTEYLHYGVAMVSQSLHEAYM